MKQRTMIILLVFSIVALGWGLAWGADSDAAMGLRLDNLAREINVIWVLLSAALVFLMQAGFMCLEAGLAEAKNSINVAVKNLGDFVIATVLFWMFGFGLMFGKSVDGLIGADLFFIDLHNPWLVAFFVFQAMFVGTAATIDSGAVAGRTKFRAYLVASGLVSGLIYPVFGHWAWGGLFNANQQGWLEAMGFLDFAGSTVVHSVGGWMALAGIVVIGPRLRKFDASGKPRRISPHNLTLAYLGTMVLFFGWFGFNCGSTLEANDEVAGIALNTMLAACFGCFSASTLSWIKSPFKRPEGEMIANGVLGGLVGITAGCAFVETTGAMWIGLIAGVVVYYGAWFVENVLRLDDVVGAVAVHGFCGSWGTLAVGLFITPEHLGETTRLHQIGVQALGMGVCFVWSFGLGWLLLTLLKHFGGGVRVTPDEEMVGLNVSEHGATSSILDLAQAMQGVISNGDYESCRDVPVELGTEAGDLAGFFNQMVSALREEKRHNQRQMAEFSSYFSENVAGISAESAKMLQVLERTQDEATRMAQAVRISVEGMAQLTDSLGQVSGDAMRRAEQAAQEAETVLGSINKLAFQTKILALNAGVEAARAGQAGLGFAVVAEKVKELAAQTDASTQHIDGQISNIRQVNQELVSVIGSKTGEARDVTQGVHEAMRAADRMLETLEEMALKTRDIAGKVDGAYQRFLSLRDTGASARLA